MICPFCPSDKTKAKPLPKCRGPLVTVCCTLLPRSLRISEGGLGCENLPDGANTECCSHASELCQKARSLGSNPQVLTNQGIY